MKAMCELKRDGAPCPEAATMRLTLDEGGRRRTIDVCYPHFRSYKSHTVVATGRIPEEPKMIVVTDHGDSPNSVWWARDLAIAEGWARLLDRMACGPVAIVEYDPENVAHAACARWSPQLNWR